MIHRLIAQFKRAYKRSDKAVCLAGIVFFILAILFLFSIILLFLVTKFIAHLVNQRVANEILALQLITLLLERPTDDSVEVIFLFYTSNF